MNLPTYKNYRIDLHGDFPGNLIVNELIERPAVMTGNILVPKHAPFFNETLVLTNLDGSPLVYGEDYIFVDLDDRWVSLTARPVSIFIKLRNEKIKNVIAQYQTIGSCPLFNLMISKLTTGAVDDDRDVWWEDLDGKPHLFPLKKHIHDINTDIYAVEALSDTYRARYDQFYKNKETSIHHDFFMGELNNLDSYTLKVKAQLAYHLDRHTNNHWNVHGIKGKNVEGLELVDNVRTANLKETDERKNENLRLAVNPTYRTIAKYGLDPKYALDITGLQLNETQVLTPGKPPITNSVGPVGYRCANAAYYVDAQGIGRGLIMGYDGRDEGLVHLNNFNINGHTERVMGNEWLSGHTLYESTLVSTMNGLLRGSNGEGMVLGNYRTNEWVWVRVNGSSDVKNHTSVKLTLPASAKWDLAFIKRAVFVPMSKGGLVLEQLANGDFNTLNVWLITSTGAVVVPKVNTTSIESTLTTQQGKAKLCEWSYSFDGESLGGLVKFSSPIPMDCSDPVMSALSYSINGNLNHLKLMFKETWGDDDVIVSTMVKLRTAVDFTTNTVSFVAVGSDATVLTPDVLDHPGDIRAHGNVSPYPLEFTSEETCLTQLNDGYLQLTYRDRETVKMTSTLFKPSYFYPQVINETSFLTNKVFKVGGDDFVLNEDGLLVCKALKSLDGNLWYDAGVQLGAYGETAFLNGSVHFKSLNLNGTFSHHLKRAPKVIQGRTFLDNTCWIRNSDNLYVKMPTFQRQQITVNVSDTRNNASFGDTWFSSVSSANRQYASGLRSAPGFYVVNDANVLTVNSYWAVHDLFLSRIGEGKYTKDTVWTILMSNDLDLLPYHLVMLHNIVNGQVETTLIQFYFTPGKLQTTFVNGSKAQLLNFNSPVEVYSTVTVKHPNLRFNNMEHVFEQSLEFTETGKWVVVRQSITPDDLGEDTYSATDTSNDTITITYCSTAVVDLNGSEEYSPICLLIVMNPAGGISTLVELNNASTEEQPFYIRQSGWYVSRKDEDYILGGTALSGYPIANTEQGIQNLIKVNESLTIPADRLPVKDWAVYIPSQIIRLQQGRNHVIQPQYYDLRDTVDVYKSVQLYLYLNFLTGEPVFKFKNVLTNNPTEKLIAIVKTSDTGISDITYL